MEKFFNECFAEFLENNKGFITKKVVGLVIAHLAQETRKLNVKIVDFLDPSQRQKLIDLLIDSVNNIKIPKWIEILIKVNNERLLEQIKLFLKRKLG